MTYIDDRIRARIAAARSRRARRRLQREEFAAARKHGLAARHAAKLRQLAADDDQEGA